MNVDIVLDDTLERGTYSGDPVLSRGEVRPGLFRIRLGVGISLEGSREDFEVLRSRLEFLVPSPPVSPAGEPHEADELADALENLAVELRTQRALSASFPVPLAAARLRVQRAFRAMLDGSRVLR